MNSRLLVVALVLLVAGVVGWFVYGGGSPLLSGGSKTGAEAYFVARDLSDEEAVKQRSESRWEGMLTGDLQRAYLHATPSYRAVYDFKHFERQYGQQLTRRGVDVESVTLNPENADEAKVLVQVHITTRGFDGSSLLELSTPVRETWVKEDGQWWFVEPR